MARRRKDEGATPLFDLPLQTGDPAPPETSSAAPPHEPVPLFDEDAVPLPSAPQEEARGTATAEPRRLRVADRLLAGVADLGVVLVAGLILALGASLLGASLTLALWPAWLLLLLAFSFLYSVVPLAFWGRTPGMLWRGLIARARDGGSLTFGQTARRWFGGVLTLALGGLPALLLPTGRSLCDLLSGSMTEAR